MTIPAFLIGTLAAGALGALYHVIRGGSFSRMVLYLFVAVIFFWVGHTFANILNLTFASIGPVRVGLAVIVTIAGLILTEFLSAVEDIPEDY